MSSSSVMTVNEGNELYRLEEEVTKLRRENETLKRQQQQQHSPGADAVNARRPQEEPFIDVKMYAIADKIESHLIETDKIFQDESCFKPAMEYLVMSLWSLIAHEYNERSLENSRMVRDSLLLKLDKANETLGCAGTVGVLENELGILKKV